jgi:hypothetical protein
VKEGLPLFTAMGPVFRKAADRRGGILTLSGFAVAAAVPFAAFTCLVLNHFYVNGAFLLDSGLLAFLVSSRDLLLPDPHVLGGGSFLATHVTPIFWITGQLRRLLPLSDAQFFAVFIGFCQALPAAGVFWLLRSGFRLASPLSVLAAAAIAIAFSFNGLALAISRYPHFEILIVGSAILFAVALFLRRHAIAAVWFAICLATREDAGLVLFGLLFVLIVLDRRYGAPLRSQRAAIAFAAIALGYSIAAFSLQLALAAGESPLARIYLGAPPFAAISAATIATRLFVYLFYRTYLLLPAVIAVCWAAAARNPYIVAGYAVCLPWALLHLTARTKMAGTLSAYYAYPFMIAAFWPLLGVLLERRRRGVAGGAAVPLLAFAAMLAASFAALGQQYNPGRLTLADLFRPPSLARQAKTERAVARLVRSKPALGKLLAGTGVVALAPDDFAPGERLPRQRPAGPVDTVVYFVHGYDADDARRLALARGLDRRYRVSGTAIRIASDRPIAAGAPIADLLVAAGSPG